MAYTKTVKDPKGMKDLLVRICPPDKKGRKSIPVLANKLGMSDYGVYKWINSGKIPPTVASKLIKLAKKAGEPLKLSDLHKFVFDTSE